MIRKISKEALGKIIQELQYKYDNLKEGEFINSTNFSIIPVEKEPEFIIPDKWFLPKTNNEYYWDLIYDWIKTNADSGHPQGRNWSLDYPFKYISHFDKNNDRRFEGRGNSLPDFTLITWEQFERYIVNEEK